jgi:D-Tyr-tRNAtyr deacylase|tara:strand:+ start:1919 stop:2128 length:210 start_codon:yes stop_codon:yes gene_type:complete
MRKLFMKPAELAEILSVSQRTLANRRYLGLQPYFHQDKKGGTVRYPIDAVEDYINNNIKNNSKFKRGRA